MTSNETAGVDEAGRGSLMGPVFAAAVVWDASTELPPGVVIRDSKKMTARQREAARKFIEERAIAWAVSSADVDVIDEVNVLQATIWAMHASLHQIRGRFSRVLVDGTYFRPYMEVPYECVPKGDSLHVCIAAASILAKTHRDEHVVRLVQEHPVLVRYGVAGNKGYGSRGHMQALVEFGMTRFHRRSFRLPTTRRCVDDSLEPLSEAAA